MKNKERKYRIVESNWYERGEISIDHTRYHVEVQKKFLWRNYWSPITEPNYDHRSTIMFKSLKEAEKLIEKLKNDEKINGWGEKVVWSDPTFEKI
jgi:hypothetical protein